MQMIKIFDALLNTLSNNILNFDAISKDTSDHERGVKMQFFDILNVLGSNTNIYP